MNIDLKDFNDFAFYAFRYALGRKNYCTADVSDLLIKYANKIDGKSKYCAEIQDAIDGGEAGMDCDVAVWAKCRDVLLESMK